MKRTIKVLFLCVGVSSLAMIARADIRWTGDGLVGDFGKTQLRGRFTATVQGAAFDPAEPQPAGDTGTKTDGAVDGSARLSLEYTTDNALIFGVVADVDTGNVDIDGFERDEFYVYLASDLGRIEIGENDGPADTLGFHAPTVGMGQIRGDSARYTGSVALLSAFDTRDAAKITVLSAPRDGFRAGISWSPEFAVNENDPDPTRRIIADDVIELGAQYVRPVGNFVLGLSASWVSGTADPATLRQDIESWSVGTEVRRGQWVAGAAYVSRGGSALRTGAPDETEINAGLAYEQERWQFGGSFALSEEDGGDVRRAGIGGEYSLTDNAFIRADLVRFEQDFPTAPSRDGTTGIVEVGVRF
jgi:hypothetical protein